MGWGWRGVGVGGSDDGVGVGGGSDDGVGAEAGPHTPEGVSWICPADGRVWAGKDTANTQVANHATRTSRLLGRHPRPTLHACPAAPPPQTAQHLRYADFIVEAVGEDEALKKQVFKRLDAVGGWLVETGPGGGRDVNTAKAPALALTCVLPPPCCPPGDSRARYPGLQH